MSTILLFPFRTLIGIARPDAPLTLSKSCTDKLTLCQCTSLLSTLTSTLISPEGAYLQTLVLPESQHVPEATTRAFSTEGRLQALTADVISEWPDGYSFRPFRIATVSEEFQYSRRLGKLGQTLLPSNKSAIYTPYFQEVLIGGVLQGRKKTDPRGASAVSRGRIWRAVLTVVHHLTVHELNGENGPFGISVDGVLDRGHWIAQCDKYRHLKQGSVPYGRNRVKSEIAAALGGWDRNGGDDAFSLGAIVLS